MDFCTNCFLPNQAGGACPRCGYDPAEAAGKYPLALRPGSILNGRYIVGRVLGQGGFGITYIALDDKTKSRVAIKEYLPTEFAGRTAGTNRVQAYSGNREENFIFGKTRFLEEAKTLAAFIGDEHIVRIHSYFEENGTAYFAMDYVEGQPLDKYMASKGGRLTVEEANALLLPLMEALETVHARGIVHRDIAPDNIIVQPNGQAKLIDFGAARYSTGEKSKSLDVVIKHGFAPYEQYMRRGRQGPFTDVYAMGATYYYAITGKVPPDAVERMEKEDLILPRTLGAKISDGAQSVLLKALDVTAANRYQTMGDFRTELLASNSGKGRKKTALRVILSVAALAVIAAGVYLYFGTDLLPFGKRTAATAPETPVIAEESTQPAEENAVETVSTESEEPEPAAETTNAGTLKGGELSGGDLIWTLDDEGTLVISGGGAMEDFSEDAPAPWLEYADSIRTVEIQKGVSSIGSHAFRGCSGITAMDIPAGVTDIGSMAFADCGALESVKIPAGVTSIGESAFAW